MSTQRTLEMDFATELNRTQRLRVYDARQDLNAADISTAMGNIIAKNIFNGSGGALTGKAAARIITKNVEEIDLV
ncbi:DUF2922 domain-containing protein [Syntrophomonas curvata]